MSARNGEGLETFRIERVIILSCLVRAPPPPGFQRCDSVRPRAAIVSADGSRHESRHRQPDVGRQGTGAKAPVCEDKQRTGTEYLPRSPACHTSERHSKRAAACEGHTQSSYISTAKRTRQTCGRLSTSRLEGHNNPTLTTRTYLVYPIS